MSEDFEIRGVNAYEEAFLHGEPKASRFADEEERRLVMPGNSEANDAVDVTLGDFVQQPVVTDQSNDEL